MKKILILTAKFGDGHNTASYQLRAAASLAGTFTLVGSPVTGDGSVQTLSETSAEPVRFYQIQVNP
jgi:hypothetical protein